ncbi:MAG TPA: cytochrome c [Opitutaceae bacterium]|jgi:mono/diheme cytochrome c family protein|nr:cytochrome c [Opitutaceae bacterium]
MSEPSKKDPRLDQAASSDESVLDSHEKLLGTRPDEGARYALLPIGILFALSALILFSGTYLNRYAGHYSPAVFNETAKPSTGEVAVKVDPVAMGKTAFNAVCITCHQATGQGVPNIYPPLAGSEWVNGPSARVIRIVLYGLKGDVHVEGHVFNAAAMPVFGQVSGSAYNWSDEKIAAVLTYVRQEWGNKAGPISADDVSAARKATGDRKEESESELQTIK